DEQIERRERERQHRAGGRSEPELGGTRPAGSGDQRGDAAASRRPTCVAVRSTRVARGRATHPSVTVFAVGQAGNLDGLNTPSVPAQHLEAEAAEIEMLAPAREAAELVHDQTADGVVFLIA